MKNLVLIGAPGSGKGTVAKELSNYTQLSTGDILREEISKKTELGKEVALLIDNGNFVGDELMFNIIKENLPSSKNLIYDGYPRNLTQIKYFEKLAPKKEDILVIFFKIDLSLLEDRIVNRETCSVCGEIHNLKTNPPKGGLCNKCGGELSKRKDDNSEALIKRLNLFKEETLPITEEFKKYPNYYEIDASQSKEDVLKTVKGILSSKGF